MVKNKTYPILYVIVRNDLSSLGFGKSEAHSGHAACAFMHEHVFKAITPDKEGEGNIYPYRESMIKWCSSTKHGFGTQVNLDANIDQMNAIKVVADEAGIICNIITDPTYPFSVNNRMFTRSEQTAMYVFGDKGCYILDSIIGNLKLKP